MPATSMPAAAIERIAVSRPEPGPRTSTSTLRTPCSIAARAAFSAASWAANGVDLREPLNPTLPDDAQDKHVALRVADRHDRVVEGALDVRDAEGDVLALLAARTPRAGWLRHYFFTFFFPATVRLGPLRVRAFVRVRWPWTGSPRRCRIPA